MTPAKFPFNTYKHHSFNLNTIYIKRICSTCWIDTSNLKFNEIRIKISQKICNILSVKKSNENVYDNILCYNLHLGTKNKQIALKFSYLLYCYDEMDYRRTLCLLYDYYTKKVFKR